jgi:hypothetical protein
MASKINNLMIVSIKLNPIMLFLWFHLHNNVCIGAVYYAFVILLQKIKTKNNSSSPLYNRSILEYPNPAKYPFQYKPPHKGY